MAEEKTKKEHVIMRVVFNVVLVILIGLLLLWRHQIAGKEYFYIAYAPFTATVRIGDKYYKNNSELISAGKGDIRYLLDSFSDCEPSDISFNVRVTRNYLYILYS